MGGGWTKIDNVIVDRGKAVGSIAVHVYLILAKHTNADGVCWPSIGKITKISGLSESSIRRGIQTLQKHGFITVKPRAKNGVSLTNLYQLTTPQPPPCLTDTTPSKSDTTPPVSQTPTPCLTDTHPLSHRHPN